MELFTLSYGKSKKKMLPIMTDGITTINVYLVSRTGSKGKEGRMGAGWFKVEPAAKDASIWRKKSATIGGNKPDIVPRIGKNGQTKINGYISKHGFQPHT